MSFGVNINARREHDKERPRGVIGGNKGRPQDSLSQTTSLDMYPVLSQKDIMQSIAHLLLLDLNLEPLEVAEGRALRLGGELLRPCGVGPLGRDAGLGDGLRRRAQQSVAKEKQ